MMVSLGGDRPLLFVSNLFKAKVFPKLYVLMKHDYDKAGATSPLLPWVIPQPVVWS